MLTPLFPLHPCGDWILCSLPSISPRRFLSFDFLPPHKKDSLPLSLLVLRSCEYRLYVALFDPRYDVSSVTSESLLRSALSVEEERRSYLLSCSAPEDLYYSLAEMEEGTTLERVIGDLLAA